MGFVDDARAHLRAAREFLEAAQVNLSLDMFTVATANAATAGVHAKDAINLFLAARWQTPDHDDRGAPGMRSLGPEIVSLAHRLTELQPAALNAVVPPSDADAADAVTSAEQLYDAARFAPQA